MRSSICDASVPVFDPLESDEEDEFDAPLTDVTGVPVVGRADLQGPVDNHDEPMVSAIFTPWLDEEPMVRPNISRHVVVSHRFGRGHKLQRRRNESKCDGGDRGNGCTPQLRRPRPMMVAVTGAWRQSRTIRSMILSDSDASHCARFFSCFASSWGGKRGSQFQDRGLHPTDSFVLQLIPRVSRLIREDFVGWKTLVLTP